MMVMLCSSLPISTSFMIDVNTQNTPGCERTKRGAEAKRAAGRQGLTRRVGEDGRGAPGGARDGLRSAWACEMRAHGTSTSRTEGTGAGSDLAQVTRPTAPWGGWWHHAGRAARTCHLLRVQRYPPLSHARPQRLHVHVARYKVQNEAGRKHVTQAQRECRARRERHQQPRQDRRGRHRERLSPCAWAWAEWASRGGWRVRVAGEARVARGAPARMWRAAARHPSPAPAGGRGRPRALANPLQM